MQRKLLYAALAFLILPSAGHAQQAGEWRPLFAPQIPVQKPSETVAPIDVGQNVASPDEAVPPASPGFDDFSIGAVQVTGSAILSQSEYSQAIESFIGSKADGQTLQAMAKAVADHARERGYIFASAEIPAQAVRFGIVQVALDEGMIDEVRIAGSNNRHMRKLLSKLEGRAAQKSDVESALLLAEDIPGITIVKTSFVREGGRGILLVQASEKRTRVYAAADNYGNHGVGPVRARLEVDYSGLFDDRDEIKTQTLITPAQPSELIFVSARYSNIVASNGTQITLTAAAGRTHQQGRFEARGLSRYAALGVTMPALRSQDASLWLNVETAYLTVDQDYVGFASQVDDILTLAASANGNLRFGAGRLSGGVSLTQGLDIWGTTGSNDRFSSRFDGSGEFTKGQMWLNWYTPLGSGFAMRMAANAQIASRPLLSSQEISLGGPGFGRGFDFSERFGDEGVLGLFELRRQFDQPVKGVNWAQLYGFVDGGYVHNLHGGFGSGSLLSTGGGLRAGIGRADLSFELAVPVDEIRYASGNKSPQVNVSLGYQF